MLKKLKKIIKKTFRINNNSMGHYYSPIPSIEEIKQQENELFGIIPENIPGIDLNKEEQFNLLNKFKEYYKEQPFSEYKKESRRYFLANGFYGYSDGIFLYCMMKHLMPKRVIEIGSGFSSAAILDINELLFDNTISCTFIDPNPGRLLSLLKKGDKERIKIIPNKLQNVDLDVFSELSEGDFLIIDSSHVSKINSDVNFIFFKILPLLKKGVYVHIHDIFYPFEYPKEWIYKGLFLNEAYLLRAFLQYNDTYKIQFFTNYLQYFSGTEIYNEMPLCLKDPGGSIWIKKVWDN